jgi:hypothetical protein
MLDFNWGIFWPVVAAILAARVIEGIFDAVTVVVLKILD